MRLKRKDEIRYVQSCLRDIKRTENVESMKNYIQHGDMTTYQHCERVMLYSYILVRKLNLKADSRSLVRGAFLHDFYLYDWHEKDASHKWHGFHHADKALENAEREFKLNAVERDIIYSHMWPLTPRHIPKTREAVIVCLVDKYCSIFEVFYKKK